MKYFDGITASLWTRILRRLSHRWSGSWKMVDTAYFENVCFLIIHLLSPLRRESRRKLGQWLRLFTLTLMELPEALLNPSGLGPWQAEPAMTRNHIRIMHRLHLLRSESLKAPTWEVRWRNLSLLLPVDVYLCYKLFELDFPLYLTYSFSQILWTQLTPRTSRDYIEFEKLK